MYALENGVAWTDKLKDAFKHNVTRATIICDGTEINEGNNLSNLTFEEQRYISGLGFIGSATARKLEANLIDFTGDINLEDKELTLKIGAECKGNNLIDFSTGWNENSSDTSYSFINDYLTVKNSTYSNMSYIEKDITEVVKANAGEILKFNFDSENSDFTSFHGQVIIQLGVIHTSGRSSYTSLLAKSSGSLVNNTYSIPNDTSDISEATIKIFANAGHYYSYSESIIAKPMLQLGTEEKEYEPYYGEGAIYINYGNFIVDKPPEVDETVGTIRVVAYDYMVKFNKPYVDRVSYPCTLLELLQDICSQAGVTLETTDFPNKNFSVVDNQFENATLRDVLQNIAKCAFSWARIGQDNKLYLDFSLVADNTETITIDDYLVNSFKKAKEYYGPVNQVTYADSGFDGQESRVKDQQSIDENGLKELVIYDNVFAYTPEKRDALIQAGTTILGLRYMPVTQLDLIGLAYLDCRDIIQIGTYGEDIFTTRVFNHTIKYNGALTDSITAEGTSNNEEAYRNTAADAFQNLQTRFIIDKANKRIDSIVEDVNDQESRLSELTIDVDGISTEVSRKVGNDEIISKINQSAESIDIDASKININGVISANNNFKITTDGKMECAGATMKNGTIELSDTAASFNKLSVVRYRSGSTTQRQWATFVNSYGTTSYDYDSNGANTIATAETIISNSTAEVNATTDLYNANLHAVSSGSSGSKYASFTLQKHNSTTIYAEMTVADSNSSFHIKRGSHSIYMYVDDNNFQSSVRLNVTDGNNSTTIYANGISTPSLSQTSKESIKKNIKLYDDNALDIVNNSEIYTYNLKSEDDEAKKHIGFVIGDEGGNYKTPNEVISANGEGIDPYTMVSILWKAMQEQQKQIEELKKRKIKVKNSLIFNKRGKRYGFKGNKKKNFSKYN